MSGADLRRISDIAPLVRSRMLSPIDLTVSCLQEIARRQAVNAFTRVLEVSALEDARRADAEIAAGGWRGPLHGIPIAVKDLIDVAGTRTTSGSAVPSVEARTDAPVVKRLRDAGAILIGKTNLHEFAYGTTSEETAFGPVKNPIDLSRSAGGFEWRLGGSPGRGHVLRRDRHRHRRFDPDSVGGMRHGRAETCLRRAARDRHRAPQRLVRSRGSDGQKRR